MWAGLPVRLPAGPAGPVIWDGAAFIGGGWGRMTQLANGHWLCVTTRFPSGADSYLRIYRSPDDGRTWTAISQVKEEGRILDNGELIALPHGTVLLTMRSLVPDVSYRLPVYASNNNGDSWRYRSNIDASEGQGNKGLWEPDFWVVDDGRLGVTYSNETHPGYSQVISERVSTDHGVRWGDESRVVFEPGGGGLRPGMSQMARMADGRYILVYEIVNFGNADVHYKISADGVTWPDGLGTRIPCQHCGPFVASLPNGLLLVTSCENEVSFSEDFGQTWQKMGTPAWDLGHLFSWPAIYVTGEHEVGVMVVPGGVQIRFGTIVPHALWPDPYTERFTRGSHPGWSRYGGTTELADGQYLLSNEGSFGMAMVGDGFWTDGTLEADVMLSTPGDAGVMFRTTNPDYTGPDDAFGYYAGLDTDGFVILGRMNYAWEPLVSASLPVATQVWYRLKVVLEGDLISVQVNDDTPPLITATDGSFYRGQIGVRAFQCDARFDNVTFTHAVPMHLRARRNGGRWNFSWPETSVAAKLVSFPDLANSSSGSTVTNAHVLTNRQWEVSIEAPTPEQGYYRLQGQ